MIRQILAITMMTLRSIRERLWMSLTTVFAVATVVAVLLAFLALNNGFEKTISGTGSPSVALVLRGGSSAEINSGLSRDVVNILETWPQAVTTAEGDPLVSPELYVIVDGRKRSSGSEVNLPLRGLDPIGRRLRPQAALEEGRMFEPGRNEIVVGRGVVNEFEGFNMGQSIQFGQTTWRVVGTFSAEGTVFESELWADRAVVQSQFNRGSSVQSVRIQMPSPAALEDLEAFTEADARLNVDVFSEKSYFADQAQGTTNIIRYLAWPLAIAMALGALAGALNTMYTAVASRAREIATLRAIGFSGLPSFVATLVESMILAGLGGILGAAAAFVFFEGLQTSTLGGGFTQVVFSFQFEGPLIAQGVFLALTIGFIGGFLPAFRAARLPIIQAFSANL